MRLRMACMQARIGLVFDVLTDHGIVTMHEAGHTQEDGFTDRAEASEEQGGATGFCFYTKQDANAPSGPGD